MESLISAVNRLQDVFTVVGTETIDLPQIVVVGNQSSGKSSVLEAIVGRTFLPRGSGIVTRRPLVLQLINSKKTNDIENIEYGQFLHKPDIMFTDYKKIESEIINETERLAGSGKTINDEPIRLKIYSSRLTDLTLVDLPGLTKIPVGDQPEDIEQQIFELVHKYSVNPNSIILAVTSANTDMATSDSLKLARKLDPNGERTLAVITKLDLMDKGTNAIEILSGKLIKMKLGIIGVVNRSQMDIENEKQMDESLIDEKKFFIYNYPLIASSNGTPYLIETLSKLLMTHIHKCLPQLKQKILSMLSKFNEIAEQVGKPILDKNLTILHLINKFVSAYSDLIKGTSKRLNTQEIYGGARIYFIFHKIFGKTVSEFNNLDGLTSSDILTAVRNTMGSKPSLFVSELAFELLVQKQIYKLEEPSLQCVTMVYDEMQRAINKALELTKDVGRFPFFTNKLVECMTHILNDALKPTIEMVKNLVKMECAYINTNHPDFINVAQLTSKMLRDSGANVLNKEPVVQNIQINMEDNGKIELTDGISNNENKDVEEYNDNKQHEKINAQLIELLIKSYVELVKKRFQDGVPKAISYFLINNVLERISSGITKELYNNEIISELLKESPSIMEKRENALKMIDVLKKASLIVSEIKESRVVSE